MVEQIRDLAVETVPLSEITPTPQNPRTHSRKQIRQIAKSIEEFGWTNPILVDDALNVIAGHGRAAAAEQIGLTDVPIIRIDDMSEAQKRAYVIADNRLAEKAGWDKELLAAEITFLGEISFDATLTGFETAEIDILLSEQSTPEDTGGADTIPSIDPEREAISAPGDLWSLGKHRLLCGDTRDPAAIDRLMDGERAQMVFTDPPYNVPIDGHVCGLGSVKHAEFAMATGEMDEAAFKAFLETTLGNLTGASADGSIHFVSMDWRHLYELLSVGRSVYDELKNLCVWNKTNGGMGSLYRSKHELVAVFKAGGNPHINNVELGRHGRYRTNVWDYPGINSFGSDRASALAAHPTVKPVALVEDAILDCSDRDGIVLDGFCGSGTTIIAAERAGRRGYGIEFDPLYVDTALRRYREVTGEDPIHAESGLPLSFFA